MFFNKKSIKLVIMLAMMTTLTVTGVPAFSQIPVQNPISIQTGRTQINLAFHKVSTYKVYLDEREVWTGKGKIENTETSQPSSEDRFNNSSLSVQVSKDQIQLEIGYIPDEDGLVEVYRNGQKIGETNKTYFADKNIKENSIYNYEVIGSKKRSNEEISKIMRELKNQQIPISKEVLNEISFKKYILGKSEVKATDQQIQSLKENPDLFASRVYYLRYTTFIPWKRIKAYQTPYYYGGDNGGFVRTVVVIAQE